MELMVKNKTRIRDWNMLDLPEPTLCTKAAWCLCMWGCVWLFFFFPLPKPAAGIYRPVLFHNLLCRVDVLSQLEFYLPCQIPFWKSPFQMAASQGHRQGWKLGNRPTGTAWVRKLKRLWASLWSELLFPEDPAGLCQWRWPVLPDGSCHFVQWAAKAPGNCGLLTAPRRGDVPMKAATRNAHCLRQTSH